MVLTCFQGTLHTDGLEVQTGPDGFTRFGPTPEPGTGLWVRFSPMPNFGPNLGLVH